MMVADPENPPKLPLAFYTNRKAMAWDIFVTVALTLLMIFLIGIVVHTQKYFSFKNLSSLPLLAYIPFLFLLNYIYFFYQLATRSLLFFLDANGITIKKKLGIITWEEIEKIQLGSIGTGYKQNYYALLLLKDKGSDFEKISFWHWLHSKINILFFNVPIAINLRRTGVDADAIIAWLNHYKDKYAPMLKSFDSERQNLSFDTTSSPMPIANKMPLLPFIDYPKLGSRILLAAGLFCMSGIVLWLLWIVIENFIWTIRQTGISWSSFFELLLGCLVLVIASPLCLGFIFSLQNCIKKPALYILEETGMRIDQDYPLIPWSKINPIPLTAEFYIPIFFEDNDNFYNNLTWAQRIKAKRKTSLFGTPFVIDAFKSDIPSTTLISWIENLRNHYGSAQ